MHTDTSERKSTNWIFFDLDDTLWDFSFNSSLALGYMYSTFEIIAQLFPEEKSFTDKYHTINLALWDKFSKGEVNSDELRRERWRATLFPDRQDSAVLELCDNLDTEYLRKLAQFPNLLEGAELLLSKLTKKVLVGILSNGFPETQYAKVMNSGLWKYITRLIASGEISINKPDKKIFAYAESETGARNPIMVGDHIETDVIGALNAGWHAIWFNPRQLPVPSEISSVIENYSKTGLFLGETSSLKETGEIIERFLS